MKFSVTCIDQIFLANSPMTLEFDVLSTLKYTLSFVNKTHDMQTATEAGTADFSQKIFVVFCFPQL